MGKGVKGRGNRGNRRQSDRHHLNNNQARGNQRTMKRLFAAIMSMAVFGALAPAVDAQSSCPEVDQAKAMLSRVAKGQDVQAPRSLAGARQDQQAPRSQDVQAPRGQDVQAPRGQDVQAPRSLAGARATSSKAFNLVKEAEAACAKGDMATAKAKAEAALAVMK